ncbi:hypothetical protein ABZX88_23565 [Kitasatospora aureofaciens]|uniref:hypothetical protein n=1 Tax=Kitasatospora aureofaciens TaxID=1894 RepID=UPI0033ADD3AB
MQNVPSLAVARLLKQRRPAVRTVLGRANCDGPMGAALLRNHRFVDFAVRGEGELAFPALLDHLTAAAPPVDVPGLCWWDGDRPVANPESAAQVPPGLIPAPDYTDWQRALEASLVRTWPCTGSPSGAERRGPCSGRSLNRSGKRRRRR